MSVNQKYLKTAAILAIFLSLVIFIISFVYAFISSLALIWVIFLALIVIVEMFVCFFAVLFFLNPTKRIFFIGLLTLFAGLIPGIMILSFYFKTKKNLIYNFEFNR